MALSACGSDGTASGAAAASASAQRVAAATGQLDALADQSLRQSGVPGMAVVVVHEDRVVYLKGFGVREAGKDARVDADTVFQLASLSKPIASTVLAALVGDRRIAWDDRVADRDPAFQLNDAGATGQVTLRDLFAHRSGLPDHAGDLLEDMGYGRAEILRRLRHVPLGNRFRSTYAYTNFGLSEAAFAAAKAVGLPWEDLSAQRLYGPLGMAATSSRHADFVAAGNRAVGHVPIDGAYVPRYVRQPDAQSPAGGVSSSVRDLAQWVRLHLEAGRLDGQPIVDAAALGETHRPQIVNHEPADPAVDRAGFYGLGWNVSYDQAGRVRLGHSGAFSMGAATAVSLVPGERLGIVVLTNAAPIGVPEALAASFLDLALDGRIAQDWPALYRKAFDDLAREECAGPTDYSKPPARPTPALSLATYAGAYANDYFGPVEVVEQAGGLALLQGPGRTPSTLRHWDGNTFVYQPIGENGIGCGVKAVAFQIGSTGTTASVRVENLDANGLGTFDRVP